MFMAIGFVRMGKGGKVRMTDLKKVIKGLEETEIMLKQAVDRGGEMAVMGAFKCYNHVSDAIALLKEQEERIKKFELERSWDENPDTMGKGGEVG